jgi:tRNA(Ile)-lysidine synthase
MDLEAIVSRDLNLSEGVSRSFVVSVSGGMDSMILLNIMKNLSLKYPLDLHIFHTNFQLRGAESKRDEDFVRTAAKQYGISMTVKKVSLKKESAIQEQARKLRIAEAKSVKPRWEWIEAHHLNDQIETFLFKLFRGAGPRSLSGIRRQLMREGRSVWRPLLEISKSQLKNYAKKNKISWIEDSSNLTTKYDRNWIRLCLLPMIEERFPNAQEAMHRLMKLLALDEESKNQSFQNSQDEIVRSHQPLIWAWPAIKKLPKAQAQDFIHTFFRRHLKVELSQRHTVDLTKALERDVNFSFNAPKKILVRGKRQSAKVKFPQICFYQVSTKGLAPMCLEARDQIL